MSNLDYKPAHIFEPTLGERPQTGGCATVITPNGNRVYGVRQENGTLSAPSDGNFYGTPKSG